MGDVHEEEKRGLRRPRGVVAVGGGADWETVNAELLRKAIAKAAIKHGALRIGYTRDGGAYAIGVYAGVQYFTDYVRPGEDIEEYLRELIEAFDEYTAENGIEPKATQKKRVK